MCGIFGVVTKYFDKETGNKYLDKMSLRGPDAKGYYSINHITLGHRRLSIIDLQTGNQPMHDADGTVVVVLNGEIYNFNELKEKLIGNGASFKTLSDTEVILEGYKLWGFEKLLRELEGMFAFALYNKRDDTLYIVRDRFGEKPLYYHLNNEGIIFASEIKAIEELIPKKTINKTALNLFLSLSYIPAPFSIYNEIKKLEPGYYIKINKHGKAQKTRYYSLKNTILKYNKINDYKNACNRLKELVSDSVKLRMISDVPVGAFLSGGIDSSIISLVMSRISEKPINTFTIGFNQKEYDERKRAKIISDKIKSDHNENILDYKDVVKEIDEIINYFDEPFGDSSALPSNFVAKNAREKVKVVLTGDAADEIFAGYEKYLAYYYKKKYLKIPFIIRKHFERIIFKIPHTPFTNSRLRKIKKVIANSLLSDFDMHYNYMCMGFSDEERRDILKESMVEEIKPVIMQHYESLTNASREEKGLYADINIVLEGDMLTKIDRMCMKNSLEGRVPFLDTKIVEFAYMLPWEFKIKGKNKKRILKDAFKDILPKETLKFKKSGFGIPIDYWFKNELKKSMEDLISKEFIEKQGIFNYDEIQRIYDLHLKGKENNKGKLWNIYVFQKWYKNRWLINQN